MDDVSANAPRQVHNQCEHSPFEKMTNDELRNFDFEKNWEQVDAMLQRGYESPQIDDPNENGLVIQQRLFMKMRAKLEAEQAAARKKEAE